MLAYYWIVKLKYFSNSLGMTFMLRLNLPSSCIIRWETYFYRLWNTKGSLWFNLRLILQSLWAEPLYFPLIWKLSLTLSLSLPYIIINITIITNPTVSRILKAFIVMFDHRKFLLKILLSRYCNIYFR